MINIKLIFSFVRNIHIQLPLPKLVISRDDALRQDQGVVQAPKAKVEIPSSAPQVWHLIFAFFQGLKLKIWTFGSIYIPSFWWRLRFGYQILLEDWPQVEVSRFLVKVAGLLMFWKVPGLNADAAAVFDSHLKSCGGKWHRALARVERFIVVVSLEEYNIV